VNADLTQFLVDVTRGPLLERFAADPEGTLAASALPPALQAAIRAVDIAALWRAGAHPMALLYFARHCGWSGPHYYACVAAADGTPTTPARR
jgi:hypothetical protein